MADQMGEAVRRQMAARHRSFGVDRTGWTRRQWIEDAEKLMNEVDGAITSLVNGHVMALLDEIRLHRKLIRQFAFDIIMGELGMDESDMDDQAYATEQTDKWVRHWEERMGPIESPPPKAEPHP